MKMVMKTEDINHIEILNLWGKKGISEQKDKELFLNCIYCVNYPYLKPKKVLRNGLPDSSATATSGLTQSPTGLDSDSSCRIDRDNDNEYINVSLSSPPSRMGTSRSKMLNQWRIENLI